MADVDCHVENGAPQHPDKLSLFVRRNLEMEPPYRPFRGRERMILLDEIDIHPDFAKTPSAERLG
jgi:hypothetical protein